jgi:hypothetical protein
LTTARTTEEAALSQPCLPSITRFGHAAKPKAVPFVPSPVATISTAGWNQREFADMSRSISTVLVVLAFSVALAACDGVKFADHQLVTNPPYAPYDPFQDKPE